MVMPPSRTISNRPSISSRVSSGCSNRRRITSVFIWKVPRVQGSMVPGFRGSRNLQPWNLLTKPIAQSVWGDHEEDLPRRPVFALLRTKVGELLLQPMRLELLEQRGHVVHLECTSVLARIPAVFNQPHLNGVAAEHYRLMRGIAA